MKNFLNTAFNVSNEIIDAAIDFPLLKSIKAIADEISKINDKQKAFRIAVVEVANLTFKEALFINKGFIVDKNNVLTNYYIQQYKDSILQSAKDEDYLIEAFNFKNFNSNRIIIFLIGLYVNDLLKVKAKLTEEKLVDQIDRYMLNHIEINFYKLLEEKEKVYTVFNSYLDSKEYVLLRELTLYKEYNDQLIKMYNEDTVLDEEGITLRDLYVEPNFNIQKSCLNEKKLKERVNNELDFYHDTVPFDFSLHKAIKSLIKDEDKIGLKNNNPQLILILGYPGQGKSSFCKRFIFDHINDQEKQNIYFVKLRHLEKIKNFLDNPIETLKQEAEQQAKFFFNVPLVITNEKFEESILLLDGFDELYMSGGFNESAFLEVCKSLARNYLAKNNKMKIIITSRYGRINPEDLIKEKALIISLQEFTTRQQLQWLKQYKAKSKTSISLTEKQITKINRKKSLEHIAELISQPILLHLVARLPEPINENTNRADIYNNLFTALIERNYDSTGKLTIHTDNDLGPDELREVIRELAFEIFLNDREYIHKDQLVNSSSPILSSFFKKNQDVESRLRLLMMSFYLKEVPSIGDDNHKDKVFHSEYAIEFLHKSLQEYLTAEKIWFDIISLIEKRAGGSRNKYYIEDFNWLEVLKITNKLFSKKLSFYILEYLREIIKNDKSLNKEELVKRLILFLPILLEKDFAPNYNSEIQDNPIPKSINSFNGYINIISALDQNVNFIPNNLPEKVSFFILNNENYFIDFKGQNFENLKLDRSHFMKCDFTQSKFEETELDYCMFIETVFNNSTFKNVSGFGTKFYNLNFNSINSIEFDLSNSEFFKSKFQKVKFSKCEFNEVRLERCEFNKSDLSSNGFVDSYIEKCNFNDVKLLSCNFSDSLFEESTFYKTDFSNSNFTRSKFFNTKLYSVNLSGANLWGVHFYDVEIEDTLFEGTILTNSIMTENQLAYAKMRGAIFPDENPDESLPF